MGIDGGEIRMHRHQVFSQITVDVELLLPKRDP